MSHVVTALSPHPAILEALLRAEPRRDPLLLADGEVADLRTVLERVIEEAEREGEAAAALRDRLEPLLEIARDLVEDLPVPCYPLMEDACRRLAPDLAPEQVAPVLARLPRFGRLIGLQRNTGLLLYLEAVTVERGAARSRLLEQVRGHCRKLEVLRELDERHGPRGRAAAVLEASLGGAEGMRIDPVALSKNLPQQRGRKRLTSDRRIRIEQALETMRRFLDGATAKPECVLVHAGTPPLSPLPESVRTVSRDDGMQAAEELFDESARNVAAVLRAVRAARLEAVDRYDPERHDPILERFDWQAFDADEFTLLPAIAVLESAPRLSREGLSELATLLRSGRPIHVLVEECTAAPAEGIHAGLGYVAVAQREAFVLQGTPSRPRQLFEGLKRMVVAPGPGAAFVATPTVSSVVESGRELAAALHGRQTPCFVYDPHAGTTWAERFDLQGNPDPERPWPVLTWSHVETGGEEKTREEAFTYAHAAALDPDCAKHLRIVPVEAWDADQLELAEYLERPRADQLHKLPFLWVVDGKARIARAVVTRRLAFAARDRMRAWRILQELAGTHNEHARRAAEAAREEALTAAARERESLEAEHAAEIDRVRTQTVHEAMERLASALLGLERVPDVAQSAAPEPAAPEPAAPAPAASDSLPMLGAVEEAFIDTVLCTTCHECTNLNPRMFQYDENKQAFIADRSGGTFAQLVKAAEKCPARCIHPGKPIPGDGQVEQALLDRAARF